MAEGYSPWPAPPPPPPVATGYSYPLLPPYLVPSSRPRLSRRRFTFFGGGTLAVIVIVITLIAVLVRVVPTPCIRACGPGPGAQVNAALYSNQKWGYQVPYDSTGFTLGNQNADGATFSSRDGDGAISFAATSGTNLDGANQAAVNALDSATFQNMQQVGPVRGAQVGLIGGQGSGYSAEYVDPSGVATPVGLVVFSATHNGVTITVTAFSVAGNSNDDAPFGLELGKDLDFPVTYTQWRGR